MKYGAQTLCRWALVMLCLGTLVALAAPADSATDPALDKVLSQMDSAAEKFRTTVSDDDLPFHHSRSARDGVFGRAGCGLL